MRSRKSFFILILCFVLAICPFSYEVICGEDMAKDNVVQEEPYGEITSLTISKGGLFEITGYYENTSWEDAVIILCRAEAFSSGEIEPSDLLWIDQKKMGNNNSFYFTFRVDEKWSREEVTLAINGGVILTRTMAVPLISLISDVQNNAIRVGNDCYDIGCSYYTENKISHSIERGGNKVYYKIGDMWFDMLSEEAVSTEYFTITNAEPEEYVEKWKISNYYSF